MELEAVIGGTFGSVYEVRNSVPVLVDGDLDLDLKSLQRGAFALFL